MMPTGIMQIGRPTSSVQRGDSAVLVTVIGVALATWVITAIRMWGMDGGPGTDLGGVGWYLGVWLMMMAAMMLPAVTPFAVSFSRISAERRRTGNGFLPTWTLLVGYLSAWIVYGLVAYGAYRLIRGADLHFLRWNTEGPYVGGTVVAAAGLYELTSLKSACLTTCRTPLQFILRHWRSGRAGAFVMGLEHGAVCVGCCWALFVVLFTLGVMSILWMALVTAVVFIQRTLPGGDRIARLLGGTLVAFGIWIAVSPSSVPGLTDPGSGMTAATDRPMTHMPALSTTPKHAPAMNKGVRP